MAHEQPLPEYVRRTGDEEFTNTYQDLLKNGRLRLVEVPASASAEGIFGDIAFETGFAYFCVAKDTWERVAIATW